MRKAKLNRARENFEKLEEVVLREYERDPEGFLAEYLMRRNQTSTLPAEKAITTAIWTIVPTQLLVAFGIPLSTTSSLPLGQILMLNAALVIVALAVMVLGICSVASTISRNNWKKAHLDRVEMILKDKGRRRKARLKP